MLNTYAFSTDRILESVYAYAALDSFSGNRRPAVLGRDQEPALRRILRGCAADLFVQLAPAVVSTSLSDDDAPADLIRADFDIPDTPARELVRPAVETILAAMVSAAAWCPVNSVLTDVYTRLATTGMNRLRAVLPAGGSPEAIDGSWL